MICLMSSIKLAYCSYHVLNVEYRSSVNLRLFTRLAAREHDGEWTWCSSLLSRPLAVLRPLRRVRAAPCRLKACNLLT